MSDIQILAFDWQTGFMFRLPGASATWTDEINSDGSMDVTLPMSDTVKTLNPRRQLRKWRTILAAAATRDDGSWRVFHAGVIQSVNWDSKTREIRYACTGMFGLLAKRLVLNHDLDENWRNGTVLIDEDHPAPIWTLDFTGTLHDIAVLLIQETMKWWPLPVRLDPLQGSTQHHRTYQCWKGQTVAELLKNLTELQDGIELRFDPVILGNMFSWRMKAAPEIIDRTITLNTVAPQSGMILDSVDDAGDVMTNSVYGFAGKDNDTLLVGRFSKLPGSVRDGQLLQIADTSHTNVTNLSTLLAYLTEAVVNGVESTETIALTVPNSLEIRPGDHASVWVDDDYFADGVPVEFDMKIVSVSGATGDYRQKVELREIQPSREATRGISAGDD